MALGKPTGCGPLTPNSFFNRPVTSWAVDSNSATLVNSINHQWQQNYGNVGVSNNDPVYVVGAGAPESTVSAAPGCGDFTSSTGTQMPVPDELVASAGTDKPVFLLDPSGGLGGTAAALSPAYGDG